MTLRFYHAVLLAVLALLPSAVDAQTTSGSRAASTPMRDPAVDALRQEWSAIVSNIRRSAELMPDSSYTFRPVPTVMSFAELLVHVSITQNSTCASTLGVPVPTDSVKTERASKAELRRFFEASLAFCLKAYQQNIAAMDDQPQESSKRYFGLVHNTAHVNEHYGNMVTYLRILGHVPPSSAR